MLVPEFWVESLMSILLNIITTDEKTLHTQSNRNVHGTTLQHWVIVGSEKFSINNSKYLSLYEEEELE
jgi:hypothetical protein